MIKEQIKDLNKMAKQAEKSSLKAIEAANKAISNIEDAEQRKLFQSLLNRAKKGNLTQDELFKEINGHKNK